MKKLLFILLGNLFLLNGSAQSVTRLLACSPYDGILRVLDTNTYAQITTKNLGISLGSINGINGLAKKPSTGAYYIVVNTSGSRYLGMLNPVTGSITSIGDLQDNFSQITFNGNNTLLGVTGTGAANPSSVYRINVTNANKTFINTVASDFGEVICYNPTNNKVYQWTGGYPYTYTRYDTTFTSSTNINPVNSTYEVTGAVYKANGKFMTFDLDNNFLRTDTVGNNDQIATNNDVLKGLAYITCSRSITASSNSVCTNAVVTLTMSGPSDATYQWVKNNALIQGATSQTLSTTGGGYFKCIISDGCGQDSLAPGKVISNLPTPVVSISGSSVICAGDTIKLTGSSGGTSQWSNNGALIQGATSNTILVTASGLYNMIKTNLNGCQDSASVGKTVTVLALPVLSVTGIPSSSICAGQSATLTASGASTYTWNASPGSTSMVVTPSASTGYTVAGTGTNNCSNTTSFILTVNALPPVGISASSYTICSGESAVLTATGASTYSWSSGAASSSISVSPGTSTDYTVTGTDANSCAKASTISLDVEICLGVNTALFNAPGVKLYPNPSNGYLALESSEQIKRIEVLDLTGKLVAEKTGNCSNCNLDLSALNSSVYIIRITHVSGVIVHSRISLAK